MITKQDLINRHEKRLSEAKKPNSSFGSLPKSLFYSNTTFTEDNWNGGEAIIRQYTDYLSLSKDNHTKSCEFELRMGDDEGIGGEFIATYSWLNDTNYAQITVRSYGWYEGDMSEWKFDHYLISYYKSRGKTDVIMKNGKSITFDEYVRLLNIIESTRFKFDISE